VEIPDQAFLDALIARGVDSNGDGQISQAEAKTIRSLSIPPSGITDLKGLEAFLHLDTFAITLNPLRFLDISANSSLQYLECTSCELSQLDLSRNSALETVICGRNRLEELDLSNNASLTKLVCNNNLFTNLDLSANTDLTTMISCGNQLTSLDISMLSSLTKVGYDNMPMLTEVCVWTLPFPPAGVFVLREYSPNVVYTISCSK
jgi:Leucine-rich repeat (LRR) protein